MSNEQSTGAVSLSERILAARAPEGLLEPFYEAGFCHGLRVAAALAAAQPAPAPAPVEGGQARKPLRDAAPDQRITAAAWDHGWPQGTKESIAFRAGVRWIEETAGASLSPQEQSK